MFAKINFHDEFYQKLKLLVLPITMQQFMLALVSATDAIMLGAVSQTSLSAVSLAGQIQFVLNLFISGISAGSGIMAAQYWGKKDLRTIEKILGLGMRAAVFVTALFFLAAQIMPEQLLRIFTSEPEVIKEGVKYLRIVSFSTFLWESHRLIFILCEVWNGSLWQRWYICVPCSATLRSMPF